MKSVETKKYNKERLYSQGKVRTVKSSLSGQLLFCGAAAADYESGIRNLV